MANLFGAFNLSSIMDQYQKQQADANAANETRYRDILKTLEGQGAASKRDVAMGGREERGEISQDLISRGLFNTSTLDSLRNRSRERESRENTRIDESVADRRAGVMERRTDQGPNAGLFAQLLQSIGQGQGAQQGYGEGQGIGRSNSFGGINRGGGEGTGNNIFASSTGTSNPNGVQTFTNPAYARPGTPEFERYGATRRWQASNFWMHQDKQNSSKAYGGGGTPPTLKPGNYVSVRSRI